MLLLQQCKGAGSTQCGSAAVTAAAMSQCVCQIENRTLKAGSAQCHLFVLSPRAHKPGPAVHKSLWHPPNSREYHPMLRVETLSEWDSG